ncbi:DUF4194 domain-containing protein [Brevibacterium luteolum]|uniref:DUF4194 domain-containing protein n=1 Tax=Brevibacterium luteolum TaxID=199591 RepID=UPI001C23C0F0|nr:DUF4194 domain-containing protein [Brevibacterium luteolum]MBU8579993.1 DUF4194 domain-containing protein [Brevibacterium luteolum]
MTDDLALDGLDDVNPVQEDETADQLSLAMFEGDTSVLFPEARQCLHLLLKKRYLSADRQPAEWETLMSNETLIRSRMHDLFLELHIDREQRIAFKRSVTTETGAGLPSLLRNASYTKEETIVLIALRQRYFASRQEGDDAVFIDRETLLDEVADRRPETATNRAMDEKRANNAIDSLIKAEILRETNDPERLQILGIVEVLLPLEKLRELLTWLTSRNSEDATETEATTDDELELRGLLP